MLELNKVLCPVDFSEPSHAGLRMAIEIAARFSAELLLVHVVPPVPMAAIPQAAPAFDVAAYRRGLSESAEQGMKKLLTEHVPDDLPARSIVIDGEPAREVVQLAESEGVDLIVMSTHGESGWQRVVFGSVAEKIVRLAGCAVLTLPEPRGN